jgi:hypothetical protein
MAARPQRDREATTMTYPAYDISGIEGSETRTGPVVCQTCGCRLRAADEGRTGWFHFAPMAGRDARGCRIACADAAHDSDGRAVGA